MSSQEQLYQSLREAIETATGRKMRSPRDFEFLAESVFEKTRQSVSVTSTERYWDQPLPHHEGIVVWGPEYHHPQWHNDGERDSLMPTITEWWSPADSIAAPQQDLLAAAKNANLYFTVERTNELRITFMKNLTDTGYVFLGVYRIDRQQSDSTHLVWERVADNCDLSNLDYLQELRH